MSNEEQPEQEISKSQRKRDAQALQELGLKLTELKPQQLEKIPVPETVISAITEYGKLPGSHGARRRQLQYIGKLMRECAYAEVSQAIESMVSPQRVEKTEKRSVSNSPKDIWIEKLEADGDGAISELLAIQPLLERQQIRQLLRNIQKATETEKARHRAKLQACIEQLNLE